MRPVYGLLLITGLVALSHALLSRQSFSQHERDVANLRPFVASQRLYEHLLASSPAGEAGDADIAGPFRALCADLLGARVGYLAPLGLSPLAGEPLSYPQGAIAPTAALPELAARLVSPHTICLPVDPRVYGGAAWAVPLWGEWGLIGTLLLGEKSDGGLYTREEIEIARASAERLIDIQASAGVARRLMALERQRLAETQALDHHTRRVLHDDILPRLHAAILALSAGPAASPPEPVSLLADLHRQLSGLLREMPGRVAPEEVARLGLVGALRQATEGELRGAFDRVAWQVEPEAVRRAGCIPSRTAEVLYCAAREAMRNAARHGRGHDSGRLLTLRVDLAWRGGLEIRVEDDGVGLGAMGGGPPARGGQGLALHSTMMAVIGGSLAVESLPGAYTRVVLFLPEGAWL